jgi:PAS domain S-box-containing protein
MTGTLSREQLQQEIVKLKKEIQRHKKTGKVLAEREEKFRGLYQLAFEGLGIHEDRKLLEVNQAMADMAGYEPSELVGAPVMSLIAPECHELVLRNVSRGYDKLYEAWGIKKNGTYYPLEIQGKTLAYKGREVRVISIRDISVRRQAEELYKTLAENSQAGVYIVQNGTFQFVNRNAAALAAYSPEELIGRDEISIVHPDDRANVTENGRKMLRGEMLSPIEFRIISKQGDIRWMMEAISSISYRGKPAILGNVMEITTLKAASEKLAEIEALEGSILDAIPHAVLGFDARQIIFASNAVEAVLGWKPDELVGRNARVLYQNNKDYGLIGNIFYGDSTKKILSVDKFSCRRKDGRDIVCRVSAARIGDDEDVQRVVAVYEDITEHVERDEALREERDRAQKYLDIAGALIIAINEHGEVTLVNQKGCEILGYNQEEILGKKWVDSFVPEQVRDKVTLIYQRLMAGEMTSAEYYENPLLTRDGDERIISWHNTLVKDEEGRITGVLSSGEDITERKLAEDKLLDYYERLRVLSSELSLTEQRERQKIATELHDRIGQSMAVSKIKLEALQKGLSSPEQSRSIKEIIELIDQLIYDTRSLTFELSPPVLYILGLGAALEWLAEQFQEKHGIPVRVIKTGEIKKLDNDMAFFLFRSTQELLINIAKHAKAQMVLLNVKKLKQEIHIDVEDDGIGFDTFKIEYPPNSSGGFGIFSIRERLNYLGGQFFVQSEPGHGTHVKMVVPASIVRKKQKGPRK